MAENTFGIHSKNKTLRQVGDYTAELYELVGAAFPLDITADGAGNLIGATYQTEWKEGATIPIKNKKGKIIKYEPDYKEHRLTDDQIKKIDGYIAENLKTN